MVRHCWSYVGVIERLKTKNIVFGLGKLEMGWHEGLWACVYKGVEVKRVNENVKRFLLERGKVRRY